MGEIYNHIVEKRLAEKAGYKDAQEYFSKELADLSVATLKHVRGGGGELQRAGGAALRRHVPVAAADATWRPRAWS